MKKKIKKSIFANQDDFQSKNVFSKMFLELIFTIEKWYTKLIFLSPVLSSALLNIVLFSKF